MYCSKCGLELKENQTFCTGCGHAAGNPLAAGTGEEARLGKFDRAIRRLSRYWYLFAGINIVLGAMGLFAIQTSLTVHPGPWEPWPHPYIWNWTMAGGLAWSLLAARIVLSFAAGWGLQRRADWGRVVAMFAGIISILQFPVGLVLGVYTLQALLGRHHATMYDHLESDAAFGLR
jgi:zinc-ribbon domain